MESLLSNILLSNIEFGELLIRMLCTAFVVILVALAVPRFGTLIGGALSGLPIVIGPAFFFLLGKEQPAFIADAATYSLLAMSANQLFLLSYIATAKWEYSPFRSLGIAVALWFICASILQFLVWPTLIIAALFIMVASAAYSAASRFNTKVLAVKGKEKLTLLCLRAILAGILVAVVTTTAKQLGSEWSGLLIAFPVGYALLSITLHEQFGSKSVIAVLHSAMLGAMGLASFCTILALTITEFSAGTAFTFALVTSCLVTTGLMFRESIMNFIKR